MSLLKKTNRTFLFRSHSSLSSSLSVCLYKLNMHQDKTILVCVVGEVTQGCQFGQCVCCSDQNNDADISLELVKTYSALRWMDLSVSWHGKISPSPQPCISQICP